MPASSRSSIGAGRRMAWRIEDLNARSNSGAGLSSGGRSSSSDFQWDVDAQCCPVSWVTRDRHRAAERFDTIHQSGEARAFAYLGSPDSVIVNGEMEIGVVGIDAHVDLTRSCVLGDVGERFGDDVIG